MWQNLAEIDSKSKETPLYRQKTRKEPEDDSFSSMDYDEIISDFVQQRKVNNSSKSVDPPSSSAKKMTASALAHQERIRQLEKTKQLGIKIRKMGELIDLMQRLAQRGQWMESEQIMFEVLRRSEDGFVRDEIGYDGLLDGYRSAAIFYYHHALIWEAEEMYDRCVAVRERAELFYSVQHQPPPLSPLLPIAQYQDELKRLENLTQQMLQKMHEIIRSLMDHGSHTEAERYLRSALNKLRQMESDSSLHERRMLYMVDLVAILYEMQRVEEAWPIIKEAIEFSSTYLGPAHQYTGLAYSHYGLLLGSQRRLEDAETALQQALHILQQCETASPLMIVQAMISVSDVQVLQFRLSDAESMLLKAQSLHEQTFGHISTQVQARLNEFSTEKGFVNLVRNVLSAFSDGRVEEALFGMENIALRATSLYGKDHPESLKIHLHWAKLLLRCESMEGTFERAKEITEDMVPRVEQVFGVDDCEVTMDTCRTLAQAYVRLGRRSAAMKLIQRVVNTQTLLLGPGHPLTLDSKYGLFECLFQLGRLDEGQVVLSDFLQHMDGISPEGRDRILAVISPLLAFLKTKESRSEFLVGCAEKLLQNQQLEDAEFIFVEQLRLREEMYLEEAKYRKHPLHHLYIRRNTANGSANKNYASSSGWTSPSRSLSQDSPAINPSFASPFPLLHAMTKDDRQAIKDTSETRLLDKLEDEDDDEEEAVSNVNTSVASMVEEDIADPEIDEMVDTNTTTTTTTTTTMNPSTSLSSSSSPMLRNGLKISVTSEVPTHIVDSQQRAAGGEQASPSSSSIMISEPTSFSTDYNYAEGVSEIAKLAASRLVPDSVSIATAQHLARLFRFVGRYTDAEFLAQQLVVLREEFWGPWDKRTTDARLFVDFIRSPMQNQQLVQQKQVEKQQSETLEKNALGLDNKRTAEKKKNRKKDDPVVDKCAILSKRCRKSDRHTSQGENPAVKPSHQKEKPAGTPAAGSNAVLKLLAKLGKSVSAIPLSAQQRSLKHMMERRTRTLFDAAPISFRTDPGCPCLKCTLRRKRRYWPKIFRMFWIPIIYIRYVRIPDPGYWR